MKKTFLLVLLSLFSFSVFATDSLVLRQEAARIVIAESGEHFDQEYYADFVSGATVMTKKDLSLFPEIKAQSKKFDYVQVEVGDCVIDVVVVEFSKTNIKKFKTYYIDFSERE